MKPELFHIAGLTIYGYGFCILVGVIAAFFHLYLNRVRLGMDVDSISTVILICFVGVFLGGKVFYFLEDPAGHWSRMDQFFGDLGNGFVFYGSFLVTLLMLWVWMRKIGWDFWDKMDDIGIAGAFVHGFGKLGCFLAGCCHGVVCGNPNYGVVFNDVKSHAEPLGEALYPVQLWDSGIVFFSIAMMLWMQRRGKAFGGQLFFFYALIYGVGRFFTESYRGDVSRGFVFNGLLSHSQLIAILVVAFSGIGYWFLRRRQLLKV
ncbi:MAG: prolipoprotein diacylglyceryl transferase [Flavobacteriaceae bacterium]|nr:prolipoprotein diacylglyceryl transferase [Flavobacteriaceae bacterium]PHX77182.1 MAG: prolipoprotein diacylglyceryl transferase [Flavobacteriales bacterium]